MVKVSRGSNSRSAYIQFAWFPAGFFVCLPIILLLGDELVWSWYVPPFLLPGAFLGVLSAEFEVRVLGKVGVNLASLLGIASILMALLAGALVARSLETPAVIFGVLVGHSLGRVLWLKLRLIQGG